MGGRNIPHNIFIYKSIMKIEKKIIKEVVGLISSDKKTFSEKKQNIIVTEKQLEKILENLKK
jgi:hypothetical protein